MFGLPIFVTFSPDESHNLLMIRFARLRQNENAAPKAARSLKEGLERFRAQWGETLVVVVSDHDHEAVNPGAIDLAGEVEARGLDLKVDHEGTAALVLGEIAEAQLLELPGVADSLVLAPEIRLVWGAPGQQFGTDWGLAAQHGSPRTTKQLAVVGGGHPAAQEIARQISSASPQATEWAGRARSFLGL